LTHDRLLLFCANVICKMYFTSKRCLVKVKIVFLTGHV
jgi:hypothetical protein